MVIKRKKSESDRVREILSGMKIEHLRCYRRPHPFGAPRKMDIDPSPGTKDMTLTFECPECGTKRFDRFTASINKHLHLTIVSFDTRSYWHPPGYSQSADDPKIHMIEYEGEYYDRLFQQLYVDTSK